MPLRAVPNTQEYTAEVRELNRRLAAGGVAPGYFLCESPAEPMPVRQETVSKNSYLIVDETGVHGGYLMQAQPFWVAGETRLVGNLQMPISEGVVDKRYMPVGLYILRTVKREYPLGIGVGMGGGGSKQPLPEIQRSLGWRVHTVPFFFRVHRAGRFLREIRALRQPWWKRLAAQAAAGTGTGALAIGALHWAKSKRHAALRAVPVPGVWPEWTDGIWLAAREEYSMIGVRDRRNLDWLHLENDRRSVRFGLFDGSREIGWVVLLRTSMQGHAQFGDLTVGTLVDALTIPGYEGAAVEAATKLLGELGADVFVTNQSHRTWVRSMADCGWLSGPSNYLMTTSPELTKLVPDIELDRVQLVRGDGDGRVNL